MTPSERRLREDAIHAAAYLRGACDDAQSVNDHGTSKLLISYEVVNRVLATLEGWQYVPPEKRNA